jgi:hypothetical protein
MRTVAGVQFMDERAFCQRVNSALECAGLKFKPGEFFLVPAQLEERAIKPTDDNTSLLRVTIPL